MVKFCDEQVRNDSPTRACLTKGKLMTGHGRKEKKTPVGEVREISAGGGKYMIVVVWMMYVQVGMST